MTGAPISNDVGIMVAGCAGNTGSTLIGTLALLDAGVLKWDEVPSAITGHVAAPTPSGVYYAGWDRGSGTVREVLATKELIPASLLAAMPTFDITECEAVATALDYWSCADPEGRSVGLADSIAKVAGDVRRFREQTGIARPVVIYLGSPARRANPPLSGLSSWRELLNRPLDSVPASLIYAAGAIEAAADFVDFTPSEGLTCPALWGRADERGTQLVGRDGSTGQTMLKAAIAATLTLRGLAPRSWYSSNHLGNDDGLVLSDPDFKWLKLSDKERGLAELIGPSVDHVVSIDYVASKGDRKESFDSVVAEDIFGGEVRLRVNWEAWDSALATAMLVDLVRLVVVGQELGLSGVQPQLGFFFKSPVGGPCLSPEAAHSAMVAFYDEHARELDTTGIRRAATVAGTNTAVPG